MKLLGQSSDNTPEKLRSFSLCLSRNGIDRWVQANEYAEEPAMQGRDHHFPGREPWLVTEGQEAGFSTMGTLGGQRNSRYCRYWWKNVVGKRPEKQSHHYSGKLFRQITHILFSVCILPVWRVQRRYKHMNTKKTLL